MYPGRRAQSVQIGALLLFAFLVVGLSVTQATLVPDENAEVEFNHNQAVQDDLVDLRSNLLQSAVTGDARTSTVQLGTRYPSRALLLNPGPPAGSLRTEAAGSLTLRNAVATDGEVADYLDGGTVSFPTSAVVYEPSYNEYRRAPTTRFQATVLSNVYDEETQVRSDQTFVSGRTLTLVPVVGEFDEARVGSTSVEPAVVSGVERTVTVESAGDPIEVALGTELSERRWRDLLQPEMGDSGYVQSVECPGAARPTASCGTLVVTLDPDTEYELRLGEVALGPSADAAEDAEAHYLVDVRGDGATVTEGNQQTVTLEVRDQFNNPVSGVTVRLTQPQTGAITNGSETNADGTVTAVTDGDGQVSVTYRAPLNVGSDRSTSFEATIDSPPSDVGTEQATATVSLTAEDGTDAVEDGDWPHPLVDAVQPTPPDTSHTRFVRVHFPSGVTDPSRWSLTDGEDSTTLPDEADEYVGEHYFVEDETKFSNEHGVPTSRVHSLGSVSLEASDSVRLVRDGRTVDAFGYEGETVDARATAAGWSFDFDSTGAPPGVVAERRVEDGGYVDANGSDDWRATPESEFFQQGRPTAETLSASTNYVPIRSGRGRGNSDPGSGAVTVAFAFEDDDEEVRQVDVEVTYVHRGSGTTETEEATLRSTSGSETLVFEEDYRMDGSDRFVDVRIEVQDGEGNPVVYTGTIDRAGQTVTTGERGGLDEA